MVKYKYSLLQFELVGWLSFYFKVGMNFFSVLCKHKRIQWTSALSHANQMACIEFNLGQYIYVGQNKRAKYNFNITACWYNGDTETQKNKQNYKIYV